MQSEVQLLSAFKRSRRATLKTQIDLRSNYEALLSYIYTADELHKMLAAVTTEVPVDDECRVWRKKGHLPLVRLLKQAKTTHKAVQVRRAQLFQSISSVSPSSDEHPCNFVVCYKQVRVVTVGQWW